MNATSSIVPSPPSEQGTEHQISAEAILFNPIGTVRNHIEEPQYIEWHLVTSHVVIDPQHVESMQGLEDYSHAMILFHMDQVCYSKSVHVPQGKHQDVPEVGMFACRCPYRPNPIGATTVQILEIRGNIITVKGLDAVNNTPVIDIKPYTPQYDFICEINDEIKKAVCNKVRLPDWIFKLTY